MVPPLPAGSSTAYLIDTHGKLPAEPTTDAIGAPFVGSRYAALY
jgi:hypothetical protein